MLTDCEREASVQNAETPPTVHPTSGAGMTARVVGGGLWVLGGQAAVLLTSILTTPHVIRMLGAEQYGVYALLNAAMTYLAFADLGLGSASTKRASEAVARNDAEGEAAVIWTALFTALASTICVGMAVLAAGRTLTTSLNVPSHLTSDAVHGLQLAVIIVLMRVASVVLNTPAVVRTRFKAISIINTLTSVFQLIASPIVLALGGKLIHVVVVILLAAIANCIAYARLALILAPQLTQVRYRGELLDPLLRLGPAMVASAVLSSFLIGGEKFLLARMATVDVVGHYAVAANLAMLVSIAPLAFTQPLMPTFVRIAEAGDDESLCRLYFRAFRINVIVAIPPVLLFCIFARPLMRLWAGAEFEQHAGILLPFLAFGILCYVTTFPAWSLLVARDRAHVLAFCYAAEAVPYLAAMAFAVHREGAMGAAITFATRCAADALILNFLATRLMNAGKRRACREYGKMALLLLWLTPAVLSSAAAFRTESWFWIAISASALCVITTYTILVNNEERDYVHVIWRDTVGRFTGH